MHPQKERAYVNLTSAAIIGSVWNGRVDCCRLQPLPTKRAEVSALSLQSFTPQVPGVCNWMQPRAFCCIPVPLVPVSLALEVRAGCQVYRGNCFNAWYL